MGSNQERVSITGMNRVSARSAEQLLSVSARIEMAIRKLPLKDAIVGDEIATACSSIEAGLLFSKMNNLPRARDASHKQTVWELEEFNKLSLALVRHILQMHSPALQAISSQNSERAHPFKIVDGLRTLGRASIKAKRSLPLRTKDKKGANPKGDVFEFTRVIKSVFERCTGTRATVSSSFSADTGTYKPSGAFFRFTRAIFEACKIEADPYTFARKVTREKKVSRET